MRLPDKPRAEASGPTDRGAGRLVFSAPVLGRTRHGSGPPKRMPGSRLRRRLAVGGATCTNRELIRRLVHVGSAH